MLLPGREYQAGAASYRYGFGGMEKSNEIKGEGNSYTAAFWEYDPRLVRRWNVDPVTKEWESPYAAFSNNPIINIDPRGDSDSTYKTPGGGTLRTESTTAETFDGSVRTVGKGKNKISIQPAKGSLRSFRESNGGEPGETSRFVASFNTKTGEFTGYVWDGNMKDSYELFSEVKRNDEADQEVNANNPLYQHYTNRRDALNSAINTSVGLTLPTALIRPLTIATAAKKIPNISYLTKAGNYPAWNTVKTRYWNLMNKGKVPTGTAQVRIRTSGEIKEIAVSKELHHINGRGSADPHNYENLKAVWPWEHAAIDASRNTGYDFIKWIK